MVIEINVADKIAAAVNAPVIVCGNSDYVINFTFDEEWENYYVKTARFIFVINGEQKYKEVTFNGPECNVPILQNITEVKVGVYAGELHTTTPARIDCKKSVLCPNGTQHEEPPEDIYNQLTEAINNAVDRATDAEASAEQAVTEANEALTQANDVVVDFNQLKTDAEKLQALKNIIEQNKGKYFSVWTGTQAEYEAVETYIDNCWYLITDDTDTEELKQYIESRINERQKVLYEGEPIEDGARVRTEIAVTDNLLNYNFIVVELCKEYPDIFSETQQVVCYVPSNKNKDFLYICGASIGPTDPTYSYYRVQLAVSIEEDGIKTYIYHDGTGERKVSEGMFTKLSVTRIVGYK